MKESGWSDEGPTMFGSGRVKCIEARVSHYGINKNVRCNWTQGQQRPVVAEFRGGRSATTGFFKGSERKAVSGTSKVDFSLWIAGWHDIFSRDIPHLGGATFLGVKDNRGGIGWRSFGGDSMRIS